MPEPLAELAALHRVQTSFVDAGGATRRAEPDAVLAVLRALDVPVEELSDVPGAIREERLRRHREVLEPAIPAEAGRVPDVAVTLPRGVHPRDCWLHIEGEPGETRRTRLTPVIRRPLRARSLDGARVERYQLNLASSVGEVLEPGYYRLGVEGPGIEASSLLMVSPRCPQADRGWGAYVPLHALRGGGDWGVGSYRALAALADWCGELGAGLVGSLPLFPLFLAGGTEPVEPSPYLPVTRLGWSELYVDPRSLPEAEMAPDARELLGSAELAAELETAGQSREVDYPSVMARVRRALYPMALALRSGRSSRRDELEAFARRRPEMVAYARFRAEGPGAPRSVDGGLEGIGEEAFYHLYAQWVAEEQLTGAGDHLYLDFPVGVHPGGFDPWWEPGAFATGVEVGAPPDPFFAAGQRWGFRPIHPEGARRSGYRHPIACLRHLMGRAAAVRIDHVMGLHRLYWIPDGADARDGVYVGYHPRELRAMVAIEAHRSGTVVVGEDLGTVPPEVRTGMEEDRMLRSWVLQFAVSGDNPLPDPPEAALASLGTHDLPRFAAFWVGDDIDDQVAAGDRPNETTDRLRLQRMDWRLALMALGGGSRGSSPGSSPSEWGADQALARCLEHLAAGPARVVMVDLEDLWLERRPENRPGTGPEAGNWRHRCARTLEEMVDDPEIGDLLRLIDRLRRRR